MLKDHVAFKIWEDKKHYLVDSKTEYLGSLRWSIEIDKAERNTLAHFSNLGYRTTGYDKLHIVKLNK